MTTDVTSGLDPTSGTQVAGEADALLFDLDGTLVDSSRALERSWTRWAVEHSVTREAFAAVVTHGRTSVDLVSALLPPDQVEAALARIVQLETADVEDVVALPGARELTEALPTDRWAIVTSGQRPVATARREAAGLRMPGTFVTADDLRRGKPDPEPFLLGARRLGVRPERCVVVEDAPAGLAAARAAGMRAIAVTTTHSANRLTDADVVVDDLSALNVTVDGARLTVRRLG